MKNNLGDRMKSYEKCYEFRIPKRTYIILRLDGVNFSKYTRMFNKPFDDILSNAMDVATARVCEYMNPKFAYTQSDEASFVFTDIENIESETIFDGKVQKLASIAASKMTSAFNQIMLRLLSTLKYRPEEIADKIVTNKFPEIEAVFDARVFIIPDYREVSNYLIYRQQDCTRNSVTMAAGSVYSHKELHGKSGEEKQEMLFQKGINWNDYAVKYKRGVVIKRVPYAVEGPKGEVAMRNKWMPDYNTPIFTQEREYLYNLIPIIQN